MSFSPGQFITAQRLNRLQPKPYWAQASSTVAASSTNADVPGCSVSFTTETDNAQAEVIVTGAFYASGVPAAISSVVAVLDTSTVSPNFAISQPAANGDKLQGAAGWLVTIPLAGIHAIKARASTSTNTVVQVYSGISVTVYEVV